MMLVSGIAGALIMCVAWPCPHYYFNISRKTAEDMQILMYTLIFTTAFSHVFHEIFQMVSNRLFYREFTS